MEVNFGKFRRKNTYLWRITACQHTIIDVMDISKSPRTGKGNIKTVRMKKLRSWGSIQLQSGYSIRPAVR
jgi:hypothetical protein